MIDLRSDTVTLPDARMRQAMSRAEVGDDVYGEDPTVRALEVRAAEQLGHEAAIFVPTGTMGNQIAIHMLSRAGSDVLMAEDSHVYLYELGAMAAWSGAIPRVLAAPDGCPQVEDVERAVPPDVYYMARCSMLLLENTHNHAGGRVIAPTRVSALQQVARNHKMALHLDGARLFNAAVSLGLSAPELAEGFDTVMFSLTKGLGAPCGSMLAGRAELIEEARVVRKRMGGGMRQAGVLAAAGLIALDNVERLADDHRRAREIAGALADCPRFEIEPDDVETNIAIAAVVGADEGALLRRLREEGVLAGSMGPGRIRFVTHLDVDDDDVETVRRAIARLGSR